jgi:hemolysin-activating ACP:hemolysin acyltransferase
MLFGRKSKGAADATKASQPPPDAAKTTPAGAKPQPAAAKSVGVGKPAPQLTPEESKRRAAIAKHFAATFGETIMILMRSPQYRQCSLADLEWLVAPALRTGQFSLTTAQSKATGSSGPVGVVLWARVSEEVDKRLSSSPGRPIWLKPQEWKSGELIWVVAAVGDGRVVQAMLKRLHETEWANKQAKMLARDKHGKPTVATLGVTTKTS